MYMECKNKPRHGLILLSCVLGFDFAICRWVLVLLFAFDDDAVCLCQPPPEALYVLVSGVGNSRGAQTLLNYPFPLAATGRLDEGTSWYTLVVFSMGCKSWPVDVRPKAGFAVREWDAGPGKSPFKEKSCRSFQTGSVRGRGGKAKIEGRTAADKTAAVAAPTAVFKKPVAVPLDRSVDAADVVKKMKPNRFHGLIMDVDNVASSTAGQLLGVAND
uniref:Uncharacterized protein n=1 Tax=Glossina brevipalpis TaxID=37001 RepID=A0A1A9X0F1_9MUSC